MNTKTITKYVGMDVHKSTISIAVLNADGKLVMQSVIETAKPRFWNSLKAYAEPFMSPSKRVIIQRGCIPCCGR